MEGTSMKQHEAPVTAASAPSRSRRVLRAVVSTALVGGLLGGFGGGCLSRPVNTQSPTTKDNFTTQLRQSSIDKVDLLFDIDNSASMGDKQEYLSKAVPDLLNRLITPYCVDNDGNVLKDGSGNPVTVKDADGNCDNGKAEFKPVHDMHIGVVTSSLGQRGGDVAGCEDGGDGNTRGELFNRGGSGPIGDMNPSNFLYWFPDVTLNQGKTPTAGATPIKTANTLNTEFADLVVGVGQKGCGIESQLESWYRFLVQPDPYDKIVINGGNPSTAALNGVDGTVIKQRHDFLRPDSLVAIIVLTDENDSEIDTRSISGTGYNFLSTGFNPPRGTSACDTNPADPACQSCAFGGSGDANCAKGNYNAPNDWGYDVNLRHVHMKAKYGVDPQFPIDRYVKGLTQTKVPDRNGEYPSGAGSYVGTPDCTNPLFSSALPDGSSLDPQALCNLPVGFQRTPDLVFYAVIGGVPNQLLHFDPNNAASFQLTAADWVKILGQDPENYDYTGIDPHMVEDYKPRAGIPGVTTAIDPTDPTKGDPAGRDWITDSSGAQNKTMPFNVDREYACIFKLDTPRDCSNDANLSACDCPKDGTQAQTLPAGSIPPVCDSTDPTKQIAAKVYPTPRELLLAKKMGDQGIAASLCPIHVTEQGAGDPLYGYRPAVAAIVERLKNALAAQCLPQPLTADATGNVPCLILEALPPGAGTCAANGLNDADPKAAAGYQDQLNQQSGGGDGGASTTFTICEVPQLVGGDLSNGTCVDNNKPGWCYVTGTAAGGGCAQAVKFSAGGNPKGGARVALQCIQQTGGDTGGSSSPDGG